MQKKVYFRQIDLIIFKLWNELKAEKIESRLEIFGYDKFDLFRDENCKKNFEYLVSLAIKLELEDVDESTYYYYYWIYSIFIFKLIYILDI